MNVLLCGLGAIGAIYADKISKHKDINFKVLVDEKRLERYQQNPTFFNGEKMNLDFVLPSTKDFQADIVIVSTKFDALHDVIQNLKNFVKSDTIILSFLNGISSEKLLAQMFGEDKLLYSYYIGHSTERVGRNITHDGVDKIVFGSLTKNDEKVQTVKNFFEKVGINYEIPDDIKYSMWLKFMINVCVNQTSAYFKLPFGEMQKSDEAMRFLSSLADEVELVAKFEGVNHPETMKPKVFAFIDTMPYGNKTSMLQDVLANRKTEVGIFAGAVIELGKKYGVETPNNQKAYDKLV